MLTGLSEEALGFLLMCLAGATAVLLWQAIGVITSSIKPKVISDLIGAVMSVSAVSFTIAYASIYYNDAELRYFIFFGIAVGAVLYFFTLGRIVGTALERIWEIFLKICGLFFKILLTPLRFFNKIIVDLLLKLGKSICKLRIRRKVLVGRKKNEHNRKKPKHSKKEQNRIED